MRPAASVRFEVYCLSQKGPFVERQTPAIRPGKVQEGAQYPPNALFAQLRL